MSKFTPGPWAVKFTLDKFDSTESDLRIIDGRKESTEHPQGPLTIATVNVRAFAPHTEEMHANARLIAAAPAMYEALKGAIAALSQNKTFPADIVAAKSFLSAAIEAAEGKH